MSEIQFGDVQHAEPNRGVRPDRDAHFHVVPVGELWQAANRQTARQPETDDDFHIDSDGDAFNNQPDAPSAPQLKLPDDELMIFVDLDVMRDMEAHAQSNTNVELGGVLLGYQQVDEDGQPFVVVTDCLRARHYEATKGSFKFTHDTWSQITDERAEFHPDLEMVGWYHTHPGWSVFLSGMDLFICNNFFNRPLDVALVIDPVAHDRGWFQWTGESGKTTRQTRGFYLMGSRFREKELNYFARLYSNGENMSFDPRYSEAHMVGGQPVVNITDNRRPIFDVAIVAMLTMQFLVVSLLAWRMLVPGTGAPDPASEVADRYRFEIRDQAYKDLLASMVDANGGDARIVDEYANLKLNQDRLAANLDGQIVRSEKLANERDKVIGMLEKKQDELADLAQRQEKSRDQIRDLTSAVKRMEAAGNGTGTVLPFVMRWWHWTIGLLMFAVVMSGIFLMGQRTGVNRAYHEMDAEDDRHRPPVERASGDRISLSMPEDSTPEE